MGTAGSTLSPDVFAVVMATGILSIAARNHHYLLLSDTLGALATFSLVVLVVLAGAFDAIKRRTGLWNLAKRDGARVDGQTGGPGKDSGGLRRSAAKSAACPVIPFAA